MQAILISDLHLEEGREDITQAFFRFSEEIIREVDHFFILGDFFEVWIGDDYDHPFINRIKDKLEAISTRVENCYFQHGNRDFLVGDRFEQETGFRILSDEYSFESGDTKYLLMHGDTLCTRDTEYLQGRALLRSPIFQADVLGKPVEERLALAQQLRAASMDAQTGKSLEIMDVTPEEVVRLMEEKETDVLIHGHTHRPAVHELKLKHNENAKRIVMSDWETDIQYVSINDAGAELLTFKK